MGEDSNYSVISDSQDGTYFSNKTDHSTASSTPTAKLRLFEKFVQSCESDITE